MTPVGILEALLVLAFLLTIAALLTLRPTGDPNFDRDVDTACALTAPEATR